MGSSGASCDAGTAAQVRLRAALAEALRRRDAVAVAALRSALSALGNAEAAATVPGAGRADSVWVAGAGAGLGAGEACRRSLSQADVSQILQAEISDRLAAARDYEGSGHADRAQRLRAEADVLAAVTGGDVTPGPGKLPDR